MGRIWAVCRRDLLHFFTTPLAWLVLAAWTMVTNGLFHFTGLDPAQQAPLYDPLYRSAMDGGAFLLTLLAPALTMNSFAAERNQGTMQLLLTLPIPESHLIIGKWLATFLMLVTLVAATLVQILVLWLVSDPGGLQVVSGYIGLILLCAFFAALGVWISLLVEHPVAAYVITFGVIAMLHLLGLLADAAGLMGLLGSVLGIAPHQQPFTDGDVQLANVAWFVGATAICLGLTHGALCARRVHG
jgi:ABC-2 type transport system permease protein